MRYSPVEIENYPLASKSMLLSKDPLAWNLAWLSWDWENYKSHPDPQFTSHVHRTMQFSLTSGKIDVAGVNPDNGRVRALMLRPAPAAAIAILKSQHREQMPLFKAYGVGWLETVMARSHLYREPVHPVHDIAVTDTSQALQVILNCR